MSNAPAKPKPQVRFRRANEDELAGWVRMSEFVRHNPDWLPFIEETNEPLYERVVAGIHTTRVHAREEQWRDPREGKGARPEQLIPGTAGSFSDRTDWLVWLLMGGRGSGKSRTGAEAIRELLLGREWRTNPRVALVGQTLESVRVDMVENTLLKVLPASSIIKWNRSTCELWVDLGIGKDKYGRPKKRVAYLKGYSSDAARKLRGPNFHLAWVDEVATWTDAKQAPAADSTTWSNMKMAVRLDDEGTWVPRIIATTTPKAVRLIRNPDETDVLNPGPGIHDDPSTVISNMSTLENLEHLSSHFFETTIKPLEGTRIYQQEVMGELLDVALGAQWTPELIQSMTVLESWPESQAGGIARTVIAVDPSIGAGLGDECGIIVASLCADGRVYILEDLSIRAKASVWCQVVKDAATRHNVECVVVEVNQGGELVEETLGRYAPELEIASIWAKVGKLARAEPVALLSDRDLVRFAGKDFERLWQQMRTWEGDGPSPDRLDAFVYAALYLLPAESGATSLVVARRKGKRVPVGQLVGASR